MPAWVPEQGVGGPSVSGVNTLVAAFCGDPVSPGEVRGEERALEELLSTKYFNNDSSNSSY